MTEDAGRENPFWHALQTEHLPWAITQGMAARYPAAVLPFAGLREPAPQALKDLSDIMEPGEPVYLLRPPGTDLSKFLLEQTIRCWRMEYPASEPIPGCLLDGATELRALSEKDVPAMLKLVQLAYPGFFRPRTPELGRYFGIFKDDDLIAMGGERLALPSWREISTVCTHPDHTGRGHGQRILGRLLGLHRDEGVHSMLHVTHGNERAVRLYRHLGFRIAAEPVFIQIRRP